MTPFQKTADAARASRESTLFRGPELRQALSRESGADDVALPLELRDGALLRRHGLVLASAPGENVRERREHLRPHDEVVGGLDEGDGLARQPLGLGLLAALGLIYALGYGATAWIVGRRILREPTAWVLAFLVGWGILRVLALIPILGGLVWFAAVVFGLGALVVAIWRARTTSRAAPAAA